MSWNINNSEMLFGGGDFVPVIPDPVDDWILASGVWIDDGVWKDEATWNDGV